VGTKTVKVPGLTIRLAYDVYDPAQSDGAGGAAENAFFTTTRTYADIPIIDMEEGALAGTLQVTIPRTGKASAKLVCALGALSFSAKSFAGLADDGAFALDFACTTKNYSAVSLRLQAQNDGTLVYLLVGPGLAYDGLANWRPWSSSASAKAYEGSYVVTMPTNAVHGSVEGLAPSGAPYLTLKMTTASQWNAGKMTWAGILANGTAISGTAVLTDGGDVVLLPLVKQTSTDFFSALAQIATDHAVTCPVMAGDPEDVTIRPHWVHHETSKALKGVLWEGVYELCGGLYQKPADDVYAIAIDGLPMVSTKYGNILPITTLPQLVIASGRTRLEGDNPGKFSLSLAATGIVSGSFKLPYDDGRKTLSATYKGVFVTDAEGSPVLSGAWYFTDKYLNTNIKRGSAVIAE